MASLELSFLSDTQEAAYFSSRTGGLFMRVIRLQYQIMMMRMLGVRNVFMANHTWVKPPFWWMLYRQNHAVKYR